MIVVIDTNVWVSGLQFGGRASVPSRALDRAVKRDVIAISDDLEREILRILTSKFRWPQGAVQAALDISLKRAVRVKPVAQVHLCRDPKDDMFLQCAAEAKADLVVTGDRDLLSLKTFLEARMVTPAEYVELP